MRSTAILRKLLAEQEFIVAPSAYDPYSTLLAQEAGFPLCYIGGYVVGAHLGCGEPLLTATEMLDVSQRIASSVSIPTIADAGAGFGNLPHTLRTLRGFEDAGVAGIHLEDQVVPKRFGYHRGEVHTISRSEMRQKLRIVLESRHDSDFVIIARTDARRAVNGGVDEAVTRLEMFVDLGADLVMAFPANLDEAQRFANAAPRKMVYVAPEGRSTRPNLSTSVLRDLGYRMVVHSEGGLLQASRALRQHYVRLASDGDSTPADEHLLAEERAAVEQTLRLGDAYAIEDLETA